MHICGRFSRASLPVQAGGFIEALEPRLLLTAGAPLPPPDGVTIIGNHPQAVKAFAWADVDRDTVTPSLTGKGYVELNFKSGLLSKIVLNGTEPATMFSLRVRPFKAAGQPPGNGLIGMGEVAGAGNSSLNTLDLSAAVLSGTIQMTGTLKTLKLGTYSGPGISLGGAPADKLSVTAGVVDSAATFTFGGQIASLTVTSWAGGLITALGIGTLSVMGGDFGADLAIGAGGIGTINVRGGNITGALSVPNGQIGNITVTGGDVTGTIIAENGSIGNITVTGVAVFEPDPENPKLGWGQVVGGNIFSPQIRASAVKGKSMGNITLTGGSLGSADTMVDIQSINGEGETQAGSIGNITIKSLKYKQSVQEEQVLDKWGDPKMDKDGNPVMRLVTKYAYQGGGIWTNLDTLGKLGNLITSGGDLGGLIYAAGGIGDVKVESILQHQTGTYLGISYTDNMEDVLSASLTATLLADPGATQVGVKSISVLGGDITGELTVTGKVGNITTKCVGEYIEHYPEALPSLTTQGGSLSSENFHASSFGTISINGGDLSGAVLADNSIGAVTVLYGTLSGSLTATTGSIGNIGVKNVAFWLLDPERVAFTGAATAGTTIGAVTVEGGNMTATLTARNAIGNISVKVLTINDEGGWDREVVEGETDWIFWSTEGSTVFGGQCEFTIDLGGGVTINTLAKLGTISGTGVDVTVNGTVPWKPSLAKLSTRKVSYISAVEGEELTNDNGDVTGRRVNRTTTILPGEEYLVNYLHNNLSRWV
jgi:hypothetical protein